MKLFSMIQMQYDKFDKAVRDYLAKALNNVSYKYTNSSIFGQLMTVVSAAIQNILSYVEDSLTEQNRYTATRKRSIYNLASISGYQPSLGTATSCTVAISFMPNNSQGSDIVINNHTAISCAQNGSTYNIVLPQEAIILSPRMDNTTKYLTIVEGRFESQSFHAAGGELYTINVPFQGDCDLDYLEVIVNNEVWERRESLYDMDPESKQYTVRVSLKKGIDVIFGNGQYGKALENEDNIKVTYLLHNGENGNITDGRNAGFTFKDSLRDTLGNEIDGNAILNISLCDSDNVNSGTNSEDIETVRNMIGLNSRSLVLSDPKNYRQYLSRFSFCGYNRTWSEPGSLIINSLVLANFRIKMTDGLDYFKLNEKDFFLSEQQKQSIVTHINRTGQQLAGAVFNIFDPEIARYAMYVYVKLKNTSYDTTYISNQIRKLIGGFFADIKSDIFIPKSDIIHLLKDNIDDIDGVNIYFISDRNEQALKNHYYVNRTYNYDPSRCTYDIKEETVYLYDGENPNIGLDSHGNIYLDNADQFPVLMGGWSFISSADGDPVTFTTVTDPLTIIYE